MQSLFTTPSSAASIHERLILTERAGQQPGCWATTREGMRRLGGELSPAELAPLQRADGPLPPGDASQTLARSEASLGRAALPEHGIGEREALVRVAEVLARDGLDLSHPAAVAHLQPPTLTLAAAADVLASVTNASVDTFDSGPSSIAIERWVIRALIDLAGLGETADGVMTPGGSMSNLLGLLLARDHAAARRGIDARREGVAELPGPLVLCSEAAHFSLNRACAALGLGEDAVLPIATDRCHRMDARAVREQLAALGEERTPIAIVATAGTTDFGSIDPLPELAAIAHERGLWFHVDAAYGFGALFSHRLAPRLDGVAFADSITLDLHKLGWQPAATSVLLVANPRSFDAVERHVEYLNPRDEAEAGYTGLLGRSLQTTRRGDAVKVAATLLGFGRRGLGQMVDACHELARHTQALILDEPELELVSAAELTTVVFRYRPRATAAGPSAAELDRINAAIRRRLLESGEGLVGRTRVRESGPIPARVCLKFTLLNPRTRPRELEQLLATIVEIGRAELDGPPPDPAGEGHEPAAETCHDSSEDDLP